MFSIDEGRHPSSSLGFSNDMERERRLTTGLRTKNLHYPSAGHSADSQRRIQRQGPCRDNPAVSHRLTAAEPHARPFAKLLLDLRHRQINRSSTLRLFVSHYNPLLCPSLQRGDSRILCLDTPTHSE